MQDLTPIIIISAGRSGSQFIVRMLNDINNSAEINHEFNLLKFKPELVKYNFDDNQKHKLKLKNKFNQYYIKEIQKRNQWIDSSYVLTDKFLIQLLVDNFPDLKIVHLVRHGELVVSSWYNKLNNEIYEDSAVIKLVRALEGKSSFPPLEKNFYWNIDSDEGKADKYFLKLTQFEKICLHWKKSISSGIEAKKYVKRGNYLQIRLEDLVAKKNVQSQLVRFVFGEKEFDTKQINLKPHNVNINKQFFLTNHQTEVFKKNCLEELEMLGYKLGNSKRLKY